MKILSGIFLRPLTTIRKTAREEPFLNLIWLFILAVVCARYKYLMQALAHAGAAFNWIAATVFIWGGLVVAFDFLIYMMMSLLLPFSSKVLNRERFRKLIAASLNVSLLLLFKPVIALMIGDTAAVIIIGMYGVCLVSYAAAYIWNEYTYKPVVAVILSLLLSGLLYNWSHYRDYKYPGELMALADSFSETPELSENSLFIRPAAAEMDTESAIDRINGFLKTGTRSRAAGYALLAKAALLAGSGATEDAQTILNDILTIKSIGRHIKMNAIYLLYHIQPAGTGSFAGRYHCKGNVKAAGPVYVKGPAAFNEAAVQRAFTLMATIGNADLEELKNIVVSLSNKDAVGGFQDDIIFAIARKYEDEGMTDAAVGLYQRIMNRKYAVSRNRLLTETAVSVLEDVMNIRILYDKYRKPYALERLSLIYKKEGENEKTFAIDNYIMSYYDGHETYYNAVIRRSGREIEHGRYKRAMDLYDKLSASDLPGIFKKSADFKKMFVKRNMSRKDIISLYATAQNDWEKGDPDKSIETLKKIIAAFPDAPESGRIIMGISEFYVSSGYYSKALKEMRYGYDKYKNTPMGFELGMKTGLLLSEELGYHAEAAAWFENMVKDFSYAYRSKISGTAVSDILFKIADIAENNERNYRKAIEVNLRIARRFADHNIAARALYNSAYLSETRTLDLSAANAYYGKVISKYSDTEYARKAEVRIGLIKRRVKGAPEDLK